MRYTFRYILLYRPFEQKSFKPLNGREKQLLVKATCPCCGEAYFVNFEVQTSEESEKMLSITQTETVDKSKIIHDLSSAISMRNGIYIENLTVILNKEFRIALDSIPEIIDAIVENLGMYQENNKLYFKK